MRGPRHLMPEMKEGGVNVTPLIDIVMVMIVFFMLVAKIGVTTGADPTIQPPETILGVSLTDFGNTLTLNVRGGPRLEEPLVTALVEKGDREAREIKIVERRGTTVDRPLERVLTAFRQQNPDAKLIILGEKDLQYHLLEQVLVSAANAKVTNVNFQTAKAK
jgi:biopolymer transport protein ExbD